MWKDIGYFSFNSPEAGFLLEMKYIKERLPSNLLVAILDKFGETFEAILFGRQ